MANLANPKIFCIVPALNEEKTIAAVVKQASPYVEKVVVVDDGSEDKTSELAANEGAKVLKHAINRGQGAALQTGNEYALRLGADIIVHFDADGQFSHKEIPALAGPIIAEGYDIVFGSRFLNKQSNIPAVKKHIIMPAARLFNFLFMGKSKFTDPQNGFRALSARAAEKIRIENDGAAHCSEIMQKTLKYKFKYKEVPVTVTYSQFGQNFFGGKGRGQGGFRVVKDLLFSKLIN